MMAAQEKASDVELVSSYLIQKIWHILYQNTDVEHMGKKKIILLPHRQGCS